MSLFNIDKNYNDKKTVGIIKKAQRYDRIAQKELYDAHYKPLMGICLRYANNKAEAQDLLQESFLKIFNSIHAFKLDSHVYTWMKRITINNAIDYYRKNKKLSFKDKPIHDDTVDDNFNEEEYPDGIYSNIRTSDILEAMHSLSPAYRTVFNLRAIEGLTHKEIGERLGIQVGTSKSNYSKARLKMKKLLKSQLVLA